MDFRKVGPGHYGVILHHLRLPYRVTTFESMESFIAVIYDDLPSELRATATPSQLALVCLGAEDVEELVIENGVEFFLAERAFVGLRTG